MEQTEQPIRLQDVEIRETEDLSAVTISGLLPDGSLMTCDIPRPVWDEMGRDVNRKREAVKTNIPHQWQKFELLPDTENCAVCGLIRNPTSDERACKGKPKLRQMEKVIPQVQAIRALGRYVVHCPYCGLDHSHSGVGLQQSGCENGALPYWVEGGEL